MVTSYTLELQHLYKVNRHDEADRFRPWSKNHNRRLLWHGSRLTNWVGILSQVSAGVSCRLQRRIAQRFPCVRVRCAGGGGNCVARAFALPLQKRPLPGTCLARAYISLTCRPSLPTIVSHCVGRAEVA